MTKGISIEMKLSYPKVNLDRIERNPGSIDEILGCLKISQGNLNITTKEFYDTEIEECKFEEPLHLLIKNILLMCIKTEGDFDEKVNLNTQEGYFRIKRKEHIIHLDFNANFDESEVIETTFNEFKYAMISVAEEFLNLFSSKPNIQLNNKYLIEFKNIIKRFEQLN